MSNQNTVCNSFQTLPSFVDGLPPVRLAGAVTLVSTSQRYYGVHSLVGTEDTLGRFRVWNGLAHTGAGPKITDRNSVLQEPIPEGMENSVKVWAAAVTPSAVIWQKFRLTPGKKGGFRLKAEGDYSSSSPVFEHIPESIKRTMTHAGIPFGSKPVESEINLMLPAHSFYGWGDLIVKCRAETYRWCEMHGVLPLFNVVDEAMHRFYQSSGFTARFLRDTAEIVEWQTFQEHQVNMGSSPEDYIISAGLAADLRKVGVLDVSEEWDARILDFERRYGSTRREDAMAILTGARGIVRPQGITVRPRQQDAPAPLSEAPGVNDMEEEESLPIIASGHPDAEEQEAAFKAMMLEEEEREEEQVAA